MGSDSPQSEIVVAGHVCLDVIPPFVGTAAMTPGTLLNVGPALCTTGGVVSNTGLALHRLGMGVRLIGKVGDDLFGHELLRIFMSHGSDLAAGMVVCPGEVTSYTIVISPPGVDRTFLHCPGANDTFLASDVDQDQLEGARLFHFGYPPLMRRMYLEEGMQLASLFKMVKELGITTSLDTCGVDPMAEAGQVDWAALLARVLPWVDMYLPSVEELLFMLDRPRFDSLIDSAGGIDLSRDGVLSAGLLDQLSSRLLEMGVAVVVIKLGDQGLYLRTTRENERLSRAGRAMRELPDRETVWRGRELYSPCFEVQAVGTTGAGDCTIAGLLAAISRGDSAVKSIEAAVAVGACSVESVDATSGIPRWEVVQRRLAGGWSRRPAAASLVEFRPSDGSGVLLGPHDRTRTV